MYPVKTERAILLLLAGLLAAGSALAYKSDKGQPINIQADHADFRADPSNNGNGTGIYTGHVVITQGSITMTAERAVVHVIGNELDTADISGKPASFQQQPDNAGMIHGYADEISYDAAKNQIDLTGEARLFQPVTQVKGVTVATPPAGTTAGAATQGERLLSADHIRYNTETQHMLATSGTEDGRVHITFPPKQLPGEAPSVGTRPAPAAATHPGA